MVQSVTAGAQDVIVEMRVLMIVEVVEGAGMAVVGVGATPVGVAMGQRVV
jgi:hypothetical protein